MAVKEVAGAGDRSVTRPNSFIFTLFGDVVRAYGGEIWIGSLTRLMAEFGLSEQAVRAAVSRMSRQGWIAARKVGNRSYYALTARGTARVDRVSAQIYLPPSSHWDGRWRMVVYRIPERIRDGRDRLRKDLAVLGFAPLSPSLWISPRDSLDAARDACDAQGLLTHVDLFVAESRGPSSDRELLERCWDTAAIARRYREFISSEQARFESLRDDPAVTDARAFVEREWLVHTFRKFVYSDPGLPAELLPTDWPAAEASARFRRSYDRVKPKALRFFESNFHIAPDRPPLSAHRPNPFDTLLETGSASG